MKERKLPPPKPPRTSADDKFFKGESLGLHFRHSKIDFLRF
jgi:hypothetical protein